MKLVKLRYAPFLFLLGLCFGLLSCQEPPKMQCSSEARTDDALPSTCFGFVPSKNQSQTVPNLYFVAFQERGFVQVSLEPGFEPKGRLILITLLPKEEAKRKMSFEVVPLFTHPDGTVEYSVFFKDPSKLERELVVQPFKKEVVSMFMSLQNIYLYLEAHPDQKNEFPKQLTEPMYDLLNRQTWFLYETPNFG